MSYQISGIGEVREDLWFTSDTLFWDLDTNEYDYVEEKNEDIINKWNEHIGKRDIVYHLGNFSKGNRKQTEEILKRLNGRINLIVGSIDSNSNVLSLRKHLASCNYRLEMTVNKNYILTLHHYPQLRWNQDHKYNSWMIHGFTRHKHPPQQGKLSLDVGFEGFDKPIHFEEVKEIMKEKNNFYEGLRKREPIHI